MTTHELKTHSEPFRDLVADLKTFEFRKNDRDFKVGDVLHLREYDPHSNQYSGKEIFVNVIHILHGGYGMPDGFCIMSIRKIPNYGYRTVDAA